MQKIDVGDYFELQRNMQQSYQLLPLKDALLLPQNCQISQSQGHPLCSLLRHALHCQLLQDHLVRHRSQVWLHPRVKIMLVSAPKTLPPNTYNLKSCFSPNHSLGFGFGKGREEMEATGPLATVKLNKNPGPGSYELGTTLSKSAYSLNGKPH